MRDHIGGSYLRDACCDDTPLNAANVKGGSPYASNGTEILHFPDERRLQRLAKLPGNIVVTGETGTGKSVVANYLHKMSDRAAGPIIGKGCGTFPETLFLSEMFGHLKGSFTDALTDRKGMFLAAHEGTLVLDDVDCLTPPMQQALLRVLDTGTIQPIGESGKLSNVNVRVISTSNRDLDSLVAQGAFREDLLYRLRCWRVHLPPIYERPAFLRTLAQTQAVEFGRLFDPPTGADVVAVSEPRFDDDALDLLCLMRWPGNIRQLSEAVKNIMAFHEGPKNLISSTEVARTLFDPQYFPEFCRQFNNHSPKEPEFIHRLLTALKWNVTLTAKILGMSRSGLNEIIRRNHWQRLS